MSIVMEARNRGGLSLAVIVLEILPAALAVALFAVVGIVHVASRAMVVSQGYELSRLDQRFGDATREHDALKLELATLKSPSKLEAAARTRLGMAPPVAGSVAHVKTR